MNTTIKLLIIAAAALAGLSACNQDNERAFFDQSAPAAYTFLQANAVTELTLDNNGVIQLSVVRTDASADASVGVKLTASTATASVINALFALGSAQVNFTAGASEATADIRFTLDDLEFGEQYKFSVEFSNAEENVSAGGVKKTDITASRKLIWEEFAEGTYYTPLQSILGLPAANWTVTMYKAQGANIYRLENFYTKGAHFEFSWDGGQAIMPYNYIESRTVQGAPTFAVRTGGTYNYQDADRDVFMFVDPDPEYTYYDPAEKYFEINYYAGFINATSGISGWGWTSDFYEITQQY